MSGERAEGDINSSPGREAWRRDELDDATRALLDQDEQVFLRQSLSTPCLDVVERAEGAWLVDAQGRRLLDFHGNSVHQVGFGHPRVVEAVKKQLDALPFAPRRFTNRAAIELGRRLADLAPGNLSKILLAPSGTAAIGMAVKLVRYATGRHKTLSMWDSFHGASLDAISIGGEALFRQGVGPLLSGTEHVPPPTRGRCRFGCTDAEHTGCTDYVDYVLGREGDFGALIAEPMRWTTVEPPPPGYWRRVREICDRHGVLLVFDEIPSCLGRTGTMFACGQMDAVPDILVIGKGLGGGIWPMAAMIAGEALDVAPDRALGHYTHEKSSVGCAAALATLDVIEEEGLCTRAQALGARALARLEGLKDRFPLATEARGMGLMLGLELRRADGSPAVEEADQLMYHCLARGLSFKLGGGNVVTLCPPLTISTDELDQALDILESGLVALG